MEFARSGPHAFYVPDVWLAEIASIFAAHERRGQMQASGRNLPVTLAAMDLRFDAAGQGFAGIEAILVVARQWRINSHDAQYLELALRRRLALATLDRGLARAAREAGVSTLLA